MANKVYSTEEIVLQGWNEPITIYPVAIKKLRQIMAMIDDEESQELSILDLSVKIAAKAMETYEPKLSDPEVLEDYVDRISLDRIIFVAAGIEFKNPDPNLLAAMAANGTTD